MFRDRFPIWVVYFSLEILMFCYLRYVSFKFDKDIEKNVDCIQTICGTTKTFRKIKNRK